MSIPTLLPTALWPWGPISFFWTWKYQTPPEGQHYYKVCGGDAIPAELLKILKKIMLRKCCTQYASIFGKLGSGHRTGKIQLSFQSQRRAMPKNVQTTTQLHSFHMLVRLCSKSFELVFHSTWTKNFYIYKLGLEKAEEPPTKLPTFIGS